jgi:ArsR family transcriptional regulator
MDEIFKALGDSTRLKLLQMIAERGEVCVCKLVDELGIGQSAVSHHLAILRRANILKSRRDGQWIHYSLNLDTLEGQALPFLKSLVETARHAEVNQSSCK